jgi:hypothetical protein
MIQSLPKPVRELDPDYTIFVKEHPCCLPLSLHQCDQMTMGERAPSQPHHVSPRNGTKGIGSKVSDRRQVPVCNSGHRYCEQNPVEVLPFLEIVIAEMNREFDAARKPKVTREPRQKTPGLIVKRLKAWAVVNEFGNIQDVTFSKAAAKASPREYVVRVEIREVR